MGRYIAVITATLIAIAVTLGITVEPSQRLLPDGFKEIIFVRQVGPTPQPAGCPLGERVSIDGEGKVELIRYTLLQDIHGCVPASSYEEGEDTGIIARGTRHLLGTEIARLIEDLNKLRWTPGWKSIETAHELGDPADGCDPFYTDALPHRRLALGRPDEHYALLRIFGEKARHFDDPRCLQAELENAAIFDAALARILPETPN